jgi:hypothetical protein
VECNGDALSQTGKLPVLQDAKHLFHGMKSCFERKCSDLGSNLDANLSVNQLADSLAIENLVHDKLPYVLVCVFYKSSKEWLSLVLLD